MTDTPTAPQRTLDEQRHHLDHCVVALRAARLLLEQLDGTALTEGTAPTALGHVVSALSKLEKRRAMLQ